MDNGFELLEKHKNMSYPNGYRGIEINGIELVLLDADTFGCLTSYYGYNGNNLKLDSMHHNVLKKCHDELVVVVDLLDGYAKNYFKNLLEITSIVLNKLDQKKLKC